MEKLYYSPFTKGDKRKKKYYLSKFTINIVKKIYARGCTLECIEPLPDSPVIVCANHAMEVGPFIGLEMHPRKIRPWSNANMLKVKTFPNHIMQNVLTNSKGIIRLFLRGLACLLSYPITSIMKSLEPIPVFKDKRIALTFEKNSESLNEGVDILLFPESKISEEGYHFCNKVQRGVAFAVKNFIDLYNKPVTIIPAYICKDLKKVVYGKRIVIREFSHFKSESLALSRQIMDEIEALGRSLPKHKATPHDLT